jgi:hypothetical protein
MPLEISQHDQGFAPHFWGASSPVKRYHVAAAGKGTLLL